MFMLAAETTGNVDHFWKAVETIGPIGGFVVLIVVAFIVLYGRIIQPELKAAREAAKEAVSKHEAIAQANAVSTSNLKELSENLLEGQSNNSKHHEYLVAQREFYNKLISEKAG